MLFLGEYCVELFTVVEKLLSLEPDEIYKMIKMVNLFSFYEFLTHENFF